MIWILMLGVFLLDQLTKYYVSHTFEYLQSVPVVPKIFHLTFVHNYGAAFGILQNKRFLFIIISLIVIGFFMYFYRQLPKNTITKIAIGLALGGTFGNLIDRIRLGYVVDFFDFQIWPIFNIADSAIVIGMILLAWQILITKEDHPTEAEESSEDFLPVDPVDITTVEDYAEKDMGSEEFPVDEELTDIDGAELQ